MTVVGGEAAAAPAGEVTGPALGRAPSPYPNVDRLLVNALRDLPSALGLAINHTGQGIRAYLVVEAEGDSFLDVEDLAMERLVRVRRASPDAAVELLLLTTREAQAFDASSETRVYSFTAA